MRYPFNRFFTDTTVFVILTAIVVFLGGYTTWIYLQEYLQYGAVYSLEKSTSTAIIIVMAIMTFYYHIKGRGNALHTLMGGFIALLIIKTIPFALNRYIVGSNTIFENFFMGYVTVLAGSSVFFFINHFIMNRYRHSSPYLVFANQIVGVVLFLGVLYFYVEYVIINKDITELFSLTVYVCMCNMVACVESNIDSSREKRQIGMN